MKLLICIILVLGCSIASARPVLWTWVLPAEYTDNTPIIPEDFGPTRIFCNDNNTGETLPTFIVPPSAREHTQEMATGTYICYLTVSAKGIQSDATDGDMVTVEGVTKTPNRATEFKSEVIMVEVN